MRQSSRAAGRAAAVPASVRPPAAPGTFPRAALALGLLIGFYALALLVLVVLALLDVFLARGPGITVMTVEGWLGSLAVAWCVGRVVLLSLGPGDVPDEIPGLPVTPEEQPGLWRRVGELADRVGTRPPVEIRVTPGAGAMVQEEARWLGLVPGERRLFLGVALLIGLPENELDAVLAHELGHYARHDTRLGALVWALHRRLLGTVRTLRQRAAREEAEERATSAARAARRRAAGRPPRPERGSARGPDHYLAVVFSAYAALCLRLTEAVSRRQEYAADHTAAVIAGRDAMVAALRRVPALDALDDRYLRDYALMGREARLLPPWGQFHGGLEHLLADDERRERLKPWDRTPRPEDTHEERSPYDSHPPTADRIAALRALPDDGCGATSVRRPALALLRAPDGLLAALEQRVLGAEMLSWRRVPWAELPTRARRESWAREAAPLLAAMAQVTGPGVLAAPSAVQLGHLLDLLDHGLLYDLAGRLPRSERAALSGGRAAREFARTALRSALRRLALLAALDSGLCRWELCWSGPAVRTVTPERFAEALEWALDHAVTDPPGTAPLRALLLPDGSRHPSDGTAPPPAPQPWPPPRIPY
ncbi:M48 family metallopeptidase [Streptomyces arenae]|uniref:M48 family metallopeptidase n=1 Tax=Streptomyces arenae TaxID=29301 RepID=UPI0026598A65|nr:M48 family metallopeptidase [Streptomyces arenae]